VAATTALAAAAICKRAARDAAAARDLDRDSLRFCCSRNASTRDCLRGSGSAATSLGSA